MNQANRHQRTRAPQQNGAVLAEPPLGEAAALLSANRRQLAGQNPVILGRALVELRGQARTEALAAARAYMTAAGEPLPVADTQSLLMAGHQPELFHPGVWVKNFALNRLARQHGATPINLVVDNDTAKATALRIPVLKSAEAPWPHIVQVPFDRWSGEIPYEERPVRDEALFADLPDRATPYLAGWNFAPLLPEYWQEVCAQRGRTSLLGERMVAGRRALERRWGCHNLELPISALCRTESFAWFAGQLLTNLHEFHSIYNACVHDHRRQYSIRSRNHPVPDLAKENDWFELPLWAWEAGKHNRGRLFARRTETQIELRSGSTPWPALPLSPDNPAQLVRAWSELEARHLKVRSRALTNTLFARLFLADLFIHGIGGGKYDELTDEIFRRFYHIDPPGFLVLSATLLLPLSTYPVTAPMHQQLARTLRDLRYNPQRHLSDGALAADSVQRLIVEKQTWIDRQPPAARDRRERFQVLRALTERLTPYVAGQASATRTELARTAHELDANGVLQRRDYAFCLYPEALLRPFCTRFLVP